MDATTFDALIKRLAATRLTRLTALRGLAAGGVAALTGVRLFSEEGEAKKKNNQKKISICVCGDANPSTCKTQKKEKDKAKKTLRRNPCAYKGKCTGVSGCAATLTPLTPLPPPPPGFNCTTAGCVGANAGLICLGGNCVNCDVESDTNPCSGGQICVAGRCQGGQACTQPTGTNPDSCPAPLACRTTPQAGDPDQCLLTDDQGFTSCTPLNPAGVCSDNGQGTQTQCVLGRCLQPCSDDPVCSYFNMGSCRSGFCIKTI
jgi:hypothetical protein